MAQILRQDLGIFGMASDPQRASRHRLIQGPRDFPRGVYSIYYIEYSMRDSCGDQQTSNIDTETSIVTSRSQALAVPSPKTGVNIGARPEGQPSPRVALGDGMGFERGEDGIVYEG